MTKVRAKFIVDSVTETRWSKDAKSVKLSPVTADGIPENERFHTATPSGSMEMFVNNPEAAKYFTLGRAFYIDFIPADEGS